MNPADGTESTNGPMQGEARFRGERSIRGRPRGQTLGSENEANTAPEGWGVPCPGAYRAAPRCAQSLLLHCMLGGLCWAVCAGRRALQPPASPSAVSWLQPQGRRPGGPARRGSPPQ